MKLLGQVQAIGFADRMHVYSYHALGRAVAIVAVISFTLGALFGAAALWLALNFGQFIQSKATFQTPTRVQLALPRLAPQLGDPQPGEVLSAAPAGALDPPWRAEAPLRSELRAGGGGNWPADALFEMEPPMPGLPPARLAAVQELAIEAREERRVEVRRGDTLMSILLSAGISTAEAHQAVASLAEVYDLRRLKPGQYLVLELERSRRSDGSLRLAGLSLSADPRRELALSRAHDGNFVAHTVERELSTAQRLVTGSITESLYASAIRQGVPAETLAEAIRVLSWDVDFQRDIQRGDRFELLFEELVAEDGRTAANGKLLYVALELQGRLIEAFRYEDPQGHVTWYDREGRSLKKALLKTPIDGARISSRFGNRRHPILGYSRMHRGVDFAAPPGTPVYAAGDGVVTMAGRNGNYGIYLRIRHNSEYETAYAHLSRIARGIRKGVQVKQGQVIGYVGSTGLSTGPHLHYEVLRLGQQINPLQVSAAVSQALEGKALQSFRQQVASLDRLRRRLSSGTLLADRATR